MQTKLGPATGVLLLWKRPDNLIPIVERMLQEDWITKVLIWSNRSHNVTQRFRTAFCGRFGTDRVEVLGFGKNVYTLGRYIAAGGADTDMIVTCDDDCLVDNWREVAELHKSTGLIAANIGIQHYECCVGKSWVRQHSAGVAFEALVGWGAAFNRSAMDVFDKYMHRYGADMLVQRKADRFFTILQGRPHALIRRETNNLPGANGSESLYRMEDHWRLNNEAAQRAIEILEAEEAASQADTEAVRCIES